MDTGFYDVAQVCPNGHVATARVNTRRSQRQRVCKRCGAETMTTCPVCGTEIRGEFIIPGAPATDDFELPSFCLCCGKAFPWTDLRLAAARDSSRNAEGLTADERNGASKDPRALAAQVPGAPAAANGVRTQPETLSFRVAAAVVEFVANLLWDLLAKLLWP